MEQEIVLLGAGYAGISFLDTVIPALPANVKITVIDRLPFHGIKPEFYALASGSTNEEAVKSPFPQHPQVIYIQDEIEEIKIADCKVICKNREVPFTQLIVALGSVDNYFNVPWAEEYTESIQTYAGALKAREAIAKLKDDAHVVIIGGGLSAVEFAADLREQHPNLRITILEQSSTILPTLPVKLHTYVQNYLEDQNIQILTGVKVTLIEEGYIHYAFQEHPISYDLCCWAAGIKPNPVSYPLLAYSNGDKMNRIIVKENYELPYLDNIFVVGDCCSSPFAPSAQLAAIQGKQLGQYFIAKWQNLEYRPAPIKLKGMLGYLGKKKGFGMINNNVIVGKLPNLIKSGILWLHKHHMG
jgi:NADH dehydrogenase